MSSIIVYLLVFAAFAVVTLALAGLIKFIFRFFFRNIKFVLCLSMALLALIGICFAISKKPVSRGEEGQSDVLREAVDEFGGLYSSKLPLLAYKFEQTGEEASADDGTPTVRIKIEYLPVGAAEIEYDPEHGRFRLSKPLEIPFLEKFSDGFDLSDFSMPQFDTEGIKSAVGDGISTIKERASWVEMPDISFDSIKENAAEMLESAAGAIKGQ